jgi:hypothetical protein
MDFNFNALCISRFVYAGRSSSAHFFYFPFGKLISRFTTSISALLLLGLLSCSAVYAQGDAARGRSEFVRVCQHCHGTPSPGRAGAFEDFDVSANKLSVYASDAGAITKAANEGYRIPEGNSNDEYLPGTNTNVPMDTWVGESPNRLGRGTTPTQLAIDISAYFATLFDAPGTPAIVSVTSGNSQASVSFTAPKSDLTITAYTVTANPGGITAVGTASPITVAGLSNGTSYTFTVTATSNAGSGKPSAASNVIAIAASAAFAATHSAPAAGPAVGTTVAATSNVVPNKAPPLSVPVTLAASIASHSAQTALTRVTPAPSIPPTEMRPAPATGVVAGTTVASTTAVAPVKATLASNASALATVFGKPIIKFAKAGNAQARVFFDAPAGSTSITGYTVNVLSNGVPTGIKVTGTKSPITVPGLTNGNEYTFTVSANSNSGTSVASAPSNAVTPLRLLGD